MSSSNLAHNIVQHFDRAADSYDRVASVQAETALRLTQKAAHVAGHSPHTILDIGCGTGFVSAAAARLWPHADITAIDKAPSMLKEAQRKTAYWRFIEGDILDREFEPEFDLILSSMALHWLPDPRAALETWRRWLRPEGHLLVATLVEGSFQEWRDLCEAEGLADGLWLFPDAGFAAGLETEEQSLYITYPSARHFLRRLKATGAATPRQNHQPFDIAIMRRLLACAPEPFLATYRVLYIKMPFSI